MYGVLYYDWGGEGAKEAPFQGVGEISTILLTALTTTGPYLVQELRRFPMDSQYVTIGSKPHSKNRGGKTAS